MKPTLLVTADLNFLISLQMANTWVAACAINGIFLKFKIVVEKLIDHLR